MTIYYSRYETVIEHHFVKDPRNLYLLVLLLVFMPLQSFALDSAEVGQRVGNIKSQNNIPGSYHARAVEKYVQNLTNEQLMSLLQQIGAERFLEQMPEYGERSDGLTYGRPHGSTALPSQFLRADSYASQQSRSYGYLPYSERKREKPVNRRQNDVYERQLLAPERSETKGSFPVEGQNHGRNEENRMTGQREQRRRLEVLLPSPQDRERLMRAVANYLTNKTAAKGSGSAVKHTRQDTNIK